jgi:type II secretory pathway pseudopilin PulG
MNCRRGLSRIEIVILFVVIGVAITLAMPTLVQMRERSRRLACEAHLAQIGKAIEQYRTVDPAASYPAGATFDTQTGAPGTSWWFAVLPFTDSPDVVRGWKATAQGGDFAADENLNAAAADGFRVPIFFCPSSPLPAMNHPGRHVSDVNRKLMGDDVEGVAVPMYAAVAGSAPDARGIQLSRFASSPIHRNTSEGRYGILSQSGVMTVNRKVPDASIRDPKAQTMLVVEQSDYLRVGNPESPDLYDLRSAWPKGVFMGATADYGMLSPLGDDANAWGNNRVWNVTTIRYAMNEPGLLNKLGIVVDPAAPRPAKEGDAPPPLPPYPPEGFGPGFNHGLNSAHPGGAHALMADVTVRFLNQAIDRELLLRLATRDDGADAGDAFIDEERP